MLPQKQQKVGIEEPANVPSIWAYWVLSLSLSAVCVGWGWEGDTRVKKVPGGEPLFLSLEIEHEKADRNVRRG